MVRSFTSCIVFYELNRLWNLLVEYYGGYEGYNKTTGQLMTLNDAPRGENRTWIFPFPHQGPYKLGLPINQIILHFKDFTSVTKLTDKTYSPLDQKHPLLLDTFC